MSPLPGNRAIGQETRLGAGCQGVGNQRCADTRTNHSCWLQHLDFLYLGNSASLSIACVVELTGGGVGSLPLPKELLTAGCTSSLHMFNRYFRGANRAGCAEWKISFPVQYPEPGRPARAPSSNDVDCSEAGRNMYNLCCKVNTPQNSSLDGVPFVAERVRPGARAQRGLT
jgi:hypothetical protein